VQTGKQIVEASLEVVDGIARQAVGVAERVLHLRPIGSEMRRRRAEVDRRRARPAPCESILRFCRGLPPIHR
jgi:hypothetical protein